METITIQPGTLTLHQLRTIYQKPVKLALDEDAFEKMKNSYDFVKKIVADEKTTYGINTGIGSLASTNISKEDLEVLQYSIVVSHAVGVGPPIEDGLVRLVVALKVNSLAQGFSGVRKEILEALMTLVNAEVYPHIPVKGSVGASGDLAPLSHLVSALLGEGKTKYKDEWIPATEGLKIAGLETIKLGPREGVSLINGTQVSTAFALKGLFLAEDLFANSVICGCLTLEAALGSRKCFDGRLHSVRRHKGQIDTAAAFRFLLADGSQISESHKDCPKVQDPYSLRCQPQILGACLTQIRNAADILLTEANGVSDNPVIIDDVVISGGNFHAEPVAFAADNLALAIAEIGSLSERRTALLMDEHLSDLPAFLVKDPGVNTGFMTAQVTSAALVSENKTLAHPASVDSIPTSANHEDHVSMATAAGRRLWDMAENVKAVLAVEWLSSIQGLDLRNLKTTPRLEAARRILRDEVKFLEKDRFLVTDIEAAMELLAKETLVKLFPAGILPSCGVMMTGANGDHDKESQESTYVGTYAYIAVGITIGHSYQRTNSREVK